MRNTPCVKTKLASTELVLKQLPRNKLSKLKPKYNKIQEGRDNLKEISNYVVGKSVFAKAAGGCKAK